MLAVLCILFLCLSSTLGQTTLSVPNNTESFDDFNKRCYGQITLKFVKESFGDLYTKLFNENFANDLILPGLEASFRRVDVTGTVKLSGGVGRVDGLVRESFDKTGGDPAQFTFRFVVPLVKCIYTYEISTSDGHDLKGLADLHILNLVLNLSSSSQGTGSACTIRPPTLDISADAKNYEVVFPQEGMPLYDKMVNSYIGTHIPKLLLTLQEVLIGPVTGEIWKRACSEVKPPFPVPRMTSDPPRALCQAFQEVIDPEALNADEVKACPVI